MTIEPQFVRYQSTMAQRRIFNSIKAPDELVQLAPEEFEACCAYLYEIEGYLASQNRQIDRDVDLILERGHERVIVQCRRFVGSITELDIQKLNSKLSEYRANAAVLLSTGPISLTAKLAAKNKRVTLIAGEEVYDWLRFTQVSTRRKSRLTGWLDSNWGKFALAFMLVMSLSVMAGGAAIGYVVYTQEDAEAGTLIVANVDPTERASAELQPTIVVLRQTPPKPTPTRVMTAVPTPTLEPTVAPPPTPLPLNNINIERFETPPPLSTDLANWPSIPAFTTQYISENSAEWDNIIDAGSVWRMGWDNTNLFGIVVVQDDTHIQTQPAQFAYLGDSIEIEIDTEFDRGNLAAADDFQYVISPGNFFNYEPDAYRFRGGVEGVMNEYIGTQTSVVATQLESGYIIAFQIPWFDMGLRAPESGEIFGISLNLNDNDTPSTAQRDVQFAHTASRQWSMPMTWGTLTLGE